MTIEEEKSTSVQKDEQLRKAKNNDNEKNQNPPIETKKDLTIEGKTDDAKEVKIQDSNDALAEKSDALTDKDNNKTNQPNDQENSSKEEEQKASTPTPTDKGTEASMEKKDDESTEKVVDEKKEKERNDKIEVEEITTVDNDNANNDEKRTEKDTKDTDENKEEEKKDVEMIDVAKDEKSASDADETKTDAEPGHFEGNDKTVSQPEKIKNNETSNDDDKKELVKILVPKHEENHDEIANDGKDVAEDQPEDSEMKDVTDASVENEQEKETKTKENSDAPIKYDAKVTEEKDLSQEKEAKKDTADSNSQQEADDDKPEEKEEDVEKDTNDEEMTNELQSDETENSKVRKSRRLTQQSPSNSRSLRPRVSARRSGRAQLQDEKSEEGEEKEEEEEHEPQDTEQKKPDDAPEEQKEVEEPAEIEKEQPTEIEEPEIPKFSKRMKVRDICFVTQELLEEPKRKRLIERKVKPIEFCTYADLRKYNRDQLRAYCFAYGSMRKKKTEMEAEMVRYLSLWNDNQPGFQVDEYIPANQRIVIVPEVDPADVHIEIIENLPGASNSNQIIAGKSLTPGKDLRASTTNKDQRGQRPTVAGQQRVSAPSTPGNEAQLSNLGAANSLSGKPGAKSTNVRSRASGSRTNNSTGRAVSRTPSGARGTSSQGVAISPNASMGNLNVDGGQGKHAVVGESTSKATKGAQSTAPQQKGNGTSFKQKVQAKQAGAKYKAAYNGAGPAIVNIVENAAAYFDGKDTPEVILDQSKSYARYQFNVDMLTEIFDGPVDNGSEDDNDNDVEMQESNGKEKNPTKESDINSKPSLLRELGRNMLTDRAAKEAAELEEMEARFQKIRDETKQSERLNMRLFQRLERAETKEEVLRVKRAFEEQHDMKFEEDLPRVVRRKIDTTLPPLDMSDEHCRVVRFKVN